MDINSTNATTEQVSSGSKGSAAKARRRRKVRKAFAGALALLFALTGAGFLANALTPDAQNAVAEQSAEDLAQQGKEIYEVACITCHGANLQGVKDRGPSLIGVGEGAVYFQVHSGRMPMLRNEAQAGRKPPRYSEQQALALAAYVNANGGGPGIVRDANGEIAMESLRGSNNKEGKIDPADVARGSDLFLSLIHI